VKDEIMGKLGLKYKRQRVYVQPNKKFYINLTIIQKNTNVETYVNGKVRRPTLSVSIVEVINMTVPK
jgi:uncharacterized Fe-S cluster-containing MiaB family protein